MITIIKCENCHWYKHDDPFDLFSNGKYYPCINMGSDGFDYWCETQREPLRCDAYCKRGEYNPESFGLDVMKGMAKMVDLIKKGEFDDE